MTRKIVFRLFLLLPVLFIVACTGLGGEPGIVGQVPTDSANSASASQEDIGAVMSLGGEVWLANCARCHGQMGQGASADTLTEGSVSAPLPDLSNYSDQEVLARVSAGVMRDGAPVMSGFADRLSTDELAAVSTYAQMMSLAIARGMVNSEADPDAVSTDDVQAAAPVETPEVSAESTPDTSETLGFVSGTITNGTADGGSPAGLTVRLHVIKNELSEEIIEGTTDESGAYMLLDVPFNATYQYVVTATYNGMMFVSDIIPGSTVTDTTSPSLDLPVIVYELTTDPASLVIDTINAQAFVQDDVLQVVQILRFVNTSDRVYFQLEGDMPETAMHVRVPEGATFFEQVAQDYLLSADGTQVYSTTPLMPGRTQTMHIAYMRAYASGTPVTQVFEYPIDAQVDIALANTGLNFASDGLVSNGTVDMGGQSLATYSGAVTSAAGETFAYTLTGTPAVETLGGASSLNPIAYLLIGAGVLALVVAGVLTIRERRTNASSSGAAAGKTRIAELMEQIAALDIQHRDGKLKDAEYTRKRDALKTELSTLMKDKA